MDSFINMISIIIPLYNKQNCVTKTIGSVLSQEYSAFEIVVVDDGSTDGSKNVVNGIVDDRVHLYTKSNGGPASARNYGLLKSKGDWILFLDADDYLEKEALSHFAELVDMYPQCSFFCANYYTEHFGAKSLYSNRYKNGYLCNAFYSWCEGTFMPRSGAALFRKTMIQRYPMNETLRRYEDAEHLFRIMQDNKVVQTTIPVMTYSLDNVSASRACDDISDDFIGHLSMKGKSMWEQYALWQLYLQGLDLYPVDMARLYKRSEMRTWKVKVADKIIKYRSKLNK